MNHHKNHFILAFVLMLFTTPALFAAQSDHGADKISYNFGDYILGGPLVKNPLSLKNQKGPSGVPLGGIGTGYFSIAPDGQFSRMNLNNTHEFGDVHRYETITGTFLTVWEKEKDGIPRCRQLKLGAHPGHYGMQGVNTTEHRGLLPVTTTIFRDENTAP